MKIKFLKPVAGYAYFEGDVAELPDEQAAALVSNGLAILIPETERENTLPEKLPARRLLFDEGYETVEDIYSALDQISGLKGITAKKIDEIKKFIETEKS